MAYNQSEQVNYGIYGINNDRQLPARFQKKSGARGERNESAELAKNYEAKDRQGQPLGLSLERLDFAINENLYWPGTHQVLHQWRGVLKLKTIEELKQQIGFENGGRVLDPQIADWDNRDLRVPADSPVLKLGWYPQGEVPRVRLGISTN